MANKRPKRLFIVVLLVVSGFILWAFQSDWLIGRPSLVTVGEGSIKHEKTVKAVFANTEKVLTSPIEGKVSPVQGEGQRFRKGEIVAKITPTGVNIGRSGEEVAVSAPISGLFYSSRDGLEQVITPENLMNLDLNGLLAQTEAKNPLTDGNHLVNKYSPIGKMVDNLSPSWMFIYLESTDDIAKGWSGKFIIGGEEYVGTVMKLAGQPKGAVICFTQYVKGTTEDRSQEIVLRYKSPSKGLLVPLSSLCSYGEEKGVYAEDGGKVNFKNVKVLDYDDSYACIEGLSEGIRVVVNPAKEFKD